MPINMVKHPHAKFQDSQHQIAQSKTIIASQSTAGAKWSLTVKCQNFWSTFYFEATIIIWSILDHDSTNMAQKVSRCKSFYFWTTKKSTANWLRHNFLMVYQKNPIQCSFWREWNFLQLIFTLQVQEMLSQKVINFNIIGHFQKSTKRHFKSKTITWDW